MNFQWYPGHMTKAKRMMQENIKLIDLVIELVDARVPMSSRNPDIDELGKNKARLILLNKADLADEKQTEEWIGYFRGKGYSAVKVNSRKGGGIKSIQGVIQEACKEKTERDRKRGILNRPVRAMVVGIPNVGKSTFINALAGKACAKTGNKPGARFCDIDAQARDYIDEKGYSEYWKIRLGHFIGQEDHEYGDVSPINKNVAEPGMIFSIEPGIYIEGKYGVRVEDLVLVTEDGHEVLNKVEKKYRIVG